MAGQSSELPIFIALTAGAVMLMVLGVVTLWSTWRNPARRRVAGLSGDSTAEGGQRRTDGLVAALGPFGRLLLPGAGKEKTRIDRLLYLAGYRSASAATTFFGIKGALAIALPLIWLGTARYLPTLSSNMTYLIAGLVLFAGMVGPNRWLESKVENRQRLLRNGFPDALDLLVICVESGLGLAASIERAGEELRFSHPELAHELSMVNAEIRAGVERETALRNLAERTGMPDIKGLVNLLIQTLRFGTSVADALRIFSEEFRDRRTQLAEEKAAKMGTKLIFPLVLCEFPAFFIISVGPAILGVIEAFSRQG
jgi:tight adherence protein C